ncbi:MAG: response regulator [Clostridia bacterium]
MANCDDEAIELKYLSSFVGEWTKQNDNIVIISIFKSAETFIFDYADNKDYNILLLDIEMPGINGVELAKRARLDNATVQIIFITGFPNFLAEGYEVSALYFLMKSVGYEKFLEVLTRASINLSKAERVIIFNIDG